MAGFAKVLASQASPCPGLVRQSPRPRITRWPTGGGQSLTRHLVRTARSPRCGPVRTTGTGNRLDGPIPAQQVLGTAGPAEVAGGCSRRPERQRLARQPLGESRSRWTAVAALAAGTGHRRPVGAGHRWFGGAWPGAGVLVACWCHRAAGAVASGLLVVHPRVALPWAAYPRAPFRGRRSRGCVPCNSTPRA